MTSVPIAHVREASHADFTAIKELLHANALSSEGIYAPGAVYLVAVGQSGTVLGTIGLELSGRAALLRSAAVQPEFHGNGLGRQLTYKAFDKAKECGVRTVYLFSTDAGNYWRRFGFESVPVDEIARVLPNSAQVQSYSADGSLASEVGWRLALEP